jgi:hypothetical protein
LFSSIKKSEASRTQLKLRAANKARQRLTRPSNHYWRRVKKHVADFLMVTAQYRYLFEIGFAGAGYFNGAETMTFG